MSAPIRILLAGEGAIAGIHLQALQGLAGAEVVCVAGGVAADTAAFAAQWGIAAHSTDYAACLATMRLLDRLDRAMGLSARD